MLPLPCRSAKTVPTIFAQQANPSYLPRRCIVWRQTTHTGQRKGMPYLAYGQMSRIRVSMARRSSWACQSSFLVCGICKQCRIQRTPIQIQCYAKAIVSGIFLFDFRQAVAHYFAPLPMPHAFVFFLLYPATRVDPSDFNTKLFTIKVTA